MVFAKQLREGVRRGRITCSVRIWTQPHVKAGGRYQMDEGTIHVDSIEPIRRADITSDLARESGFRSVAALLETAKFASDAQTLIDRLRRESLRDYQPGLLAGFEPRSSDVLDPGQPATTKAPGQRPVTLTPRPGDSGLR